MHPLTTHTHTYIYAGTEVRERRRRCIKMTTGSKAFDAILGGGVESGSITEAYGEFRTVSEERERGEVLMLEIQSEVIHTRLHRERLNWLIHLL